MKLKVINCQTGQLQEKNWDGDICLIGRKKSCHIILNDLEVSNIHGLITTKDGELEYTDLDSTNGSCVNNQDIESMQSYTLKLADSISIGDYLILIESESNKHNQSHHEESFGLPQPKVTQDKHHALDEALHQEIATQAIVIFAKSDKEITCDGNESIQAIAKKTGVNIKRACGIGVCGACKSKLAEGEVKYEKEPKALSDSERKQGYCLTCIARPIGRVIVDA